MKSAEYMVLVIVIWTQLNYLSIAKLSCYIWKSMIKV